MDTLINFIHFEDYFIFILQRIECSIKMFEKLLKDNPQVSQRCKEYSISIDDVHEKLIKDMIHGKISEEPSEQAPASGESAMATRPAVKKPFLLEVCTCK